jgi:hypothetical protein
MLRSASMADFCVCMCVYYVANKQEEAAAEKEWTWPMQLEESNRCSYTVHVLFLSCLRFSPSPPLLSPNRGCLLTHGLRAVSRGSLVSHDFPSPLHHTPPSPALLSFFVLRRCARHLNVFLFYDAMMRWWLTSTTTLNDQTKTNTR